VQVETIAEPVLSPGCVLVRMLTSPINPSDLMTVRGEYGHQPDLPMTPGYEGVGIVESAQAGLYGRYLVGQRVAVLNREGGNWAERTVVPAMQVIPVPKNLSHDQAAMFFVNPATAYLLTRSVLQVPRAAWLLQTAGASAVGQMIVRLGRQHGFRTLCVVRRSSAVEKLKDQGADEVIVFDAEHEPAESLARQVNEQTGGRGVGYAVDPIGGATASALVSCLASGGRLVLYGTLSPAPLSFSPRVLMGRGATVEGFWLTQRMNAMPLLSKLGLIRTLSRLSARGLTAVDVAGTYPLADVAAAVQAAEAPNKSGKVLLRLSER
jgi:NADPH:quinone reductase-like Zn-dependent oxidoreductase